MKPLSSKLDKYKKDGCMPISSSCVVWNGPDIPCIDLCKGDTIEEVVYQLAVILCDITENVLDVTTLDFECLLADGQCPPKTILETLQLLISNACNDEESDVTPTPGDGALPIINLPECIWYTDSEGDEVTALRLDDYVEYLASIICQILLDVASINTVITSLNTRVTILEAAIGGGGGGGGTTTTITTQCLSGSAPGQVLPITTAFTNLEQKLCDYLALLGSLTEWQAMFENICIDSTTVLPCGTGTYGDLPGWLNDPQTVAGAMNNLWLVVCKLNDCISVTPALPCVLLPPTSVTLSNLTSTSCKVNWVAPATPSSQPPIGYKIEVFTLTGTTPLLTANVGLTPTSYTISNPSIVVGQQYIVKVSAVYDPCGTSLPVQVQGDLLSPAYAAYLFYENTNGGSVAKTCTNPSTGISVPYTEAKRQITISLKDSGGAPLVNSGPPIETTIKIRKSACSPTPDVIGDLVITINTGVSSGSATFVSSELVHCPGSFANCSLSTASVDCYDGSVYAGGGTLPTSIGIDTSLSSLGNC